MVGCGDLSWTFSLCSTLAHKTHLAASNSRQQLSLCPGQLASGSLPLFSAVVECLFDEARHQLATRSWRWHQGSVQFMGLPKTLGLWEVRTAAGKTCTGAPAIFVCTSFDCASPRSHIQGPYPAARVFVFVFVSLGRLISLLPVCIRLLPSLGWTLVASALQLTNLFHFFLSPLVFTVFVNKTIQLKCLDLRTCDHITCADINYPPTPA